MLFNTADFAVFFILVFSLYWALRSRFRAQNAMLLAASYLFYGWWDIRFLFLIVLSTAVDYIAGLMIDQGHVSIRQRVIASLFLLVSALFFVALDYEAVSVIRSGLSMSIDVGWLQLFSNDMGWLVFGVTAAVVIVANLAYPVSAVHWSETTRRKAFIALSIVSNLTILGFFKYFNFFSENLIVLSEALIGVTPGWWTLEIVLPVGISFYTFQTMSYTIDVYRRKLKASTHMVEFATYVAFFPQLVAGPIERGKHLLPQFRKARPALTRDAFREGSWLIGWGLYKKMVIADSMAIIVNNTFGPYDSLSITTVPDDGLRLLVALYAFAIQIYCDFSGYTDIARGIAKLLGFDIMLNFNLPYFATSPSDFWGRWHISLSSWLRDYLYIPLGGNRGSQFKTYRNLALTMLLGGLWHGAAWNFIIWGAYHGFLLTIYRVIGLRTEKGEQCWWVRGVMIFVMFHLTCIGWLLFRAQNIETIGIFLQSIITSPFGSAEAVSDFRELLYYGWFLIAFQVIQWTTGTLNPMARWHWFVRLNVWIFIIMSLLTLARTGGQEFIYFAF